MNLQGVKSADTSLDLVLSPQCYWIPCCPCSKYEDEEIKITISITIHKYLRQFIHSDLSRGHHKVLLERMI